MRRFKIPSIPPTVNKTIRFPNDIVEKVEEEILGKECTFSAFIVATTRLALADLEETREYECLQQKESGK